MKSLLYWRLRTAAQLTGDYCASLVAAPFYRRMFEGVKSYCMFAGYPRSGHSLVGSMLDAHPDMVIAFELDALQRVQYGFTRDQLFYLISHNSEGFAKRGSRWTGYSYKVDNQWQGKVNKPVIIGDKKGGETSRRLAAHPGLLEQLARRVKVPVKVVHVVRNPYDNIASMVLRGDHPTVEQATEAYFRLADVVQSLRAQSDLCQTIDIFHETMISQPRIELNTLCSFLGVVCSSEYLDQCAGIVFDRPHKTRHDVNWSSASLHRVETCLSLYPFLSHYEFSD